MRSGLVIWMLLLMAGLVKADNPVTLTQRPDGLLLVESKGTELAEVLKRIGSLTGVAITMGALSGVPRSVRCEERDLRLMLKCLGGGGVSFMIRFKALTCSGSQSPWCGAEVKIWEGVDSAPKPGRSDELHRVAPEIEALLKSPLASNRSRGIDSLLENANLEGPLVLSLLRELMADPSSGVRASAIHGLATFEAADSLAMILTATQDGSADVRLAAIDAVPEDEGSRSVLEQAIKDENPEVRELASMRLESLIYNARSDSEEN